MLTSLNIPLVGIFQWMPNSGNEAKRMEAEIIRYERIIKKVLMDSKVDGRKLYWKLKREHNIQLVTVPRKNMNKSPERQYMIKDMQTKSNLKDYKEQSITVEPMRGLMKDHL